MFSAILTHTSNVKIQFCDLFITSAVFGYWTVSGYVVSKLHFQQSWHVARLIVKSSHRHRRCVQDVSIEGAMRSGVHIRCFSDS